ncbi:hypothetical protein I6J72_09245 [Corynebacterium sp. FDAARGOS 1242]|uniref:hypothetical protein n=1 Tax=Corynebacterium sp. FDAARGOS 1242 TaxID=2778078 RepID=UPI0019523372|nr:hypothetical protein [Corynebacterium sp. FDAARGOS 1242]QRP97356.1 hypothetical protein I6J72_09245 [Corynebacterium sp. FDAARGOS 1242]
MSSISSWLATVIAAVMPFAGSTGPVDAQDQLSQPDPAETSQSAPSEAGEQRVLDQQPGAHAEKGRITGDKEDVINGAAEGSDDVDPGFNGGNLQSGKLAVQRELALATQEVGHEFMNIEFEDDHSAHLTFPETYNPEKDEAAVQRVMDALKVNGYENITAAY